MEKVRTKIYKDKNIYGGFEPFPLNLDAFGVNTTVFEEVLNELKPKLIIEVGTWIGSSAICMANILKNIHEDFEIVCVDTWLGSVEHWVEGSCVDFHDHLENGRPNLIYKRFLSNVIQSGFTDNITPLSIDSVNAFEIFRKLQVTPDMVYIDAAHDYTSVKIDVYNYSTILRNGGYLLGDDWFHPPIKSAVYDTFEQDKVITKSQDKFLWIK